VTVHVDVDSRPGAWLRNSDAIDVRRINLVRVLQIIMRDGDTSTRARIARETSLTSATVSSLVAQLMESRLVVEGDRATSEGGRRATTLSVDVKHHVVLALIARPHALSVGTVDLAGNLIEASSRELARPITADDVVELAVECARDQTANILAIGIQIPGVVNQREVIESAQLAWEGIRIADPIEKSLDVSTFLINDAAAEALAECAAARWQTRSQLFVHLGEGIGAAKVENGELATGGSGRAGEIGHVRVVFDESAAHCRCGRRGCLESVASLSAILGAEYRDDASAADVSRLASEPAAAERMSRASRALSRVLLFACALVDPDEVVIDRHAAALGQGFLTAINDDFDRHHGMGTRNVVARYASNDKPFFGVAQFALSRATGLRWNAAELPRQTRHDL